MASSSVSQESLDREDFELNARRTRIRKARGAFPRSGDRELDASGDREGRDMNGDDPSHCGTGVIQEHESPTRSAAVQRAKDKRTRPNHLQKGKLPKDKRKLREKRRSTGVVHLASTTESTGDSLDDEVDEDRLLNEAKRNTQCNEVIDADNPQTPSEVMRRIQQFQAMQMPSKEPVRSATQMQPAESTVQRGFVSRRNKSPSDLEADLEDNQDYDSTVSQSDTNLTLIGQPGGRDFDPAPRSSLGRPTAQPTYLPPDQIRPFRSYSSNTSDLDSRPPTTNSSSSSSSYTVLSRYTESAQKENDLPHTDKGPLSPKSPKSPSHSGEISRPVSSVLARYQLQEKARQEDASPMGYGYTRSRYRDRDHGVRGPLGQQFSSYLNRDNKDEDKQRLERDLERERDENKRLQKVLEEKDRRIAELERDIAMMNRDLDEIDDENQKLHIENRALIQAVGQLSTHV